VGRSTVLDGNRPEKMVGGRRDRQGRAARQVRSDGEGERCRLLQNRAGYTVLREDQSEVETKR